MNRAQPLESPALSAASRAMSMRRLVSRYAAQSGSLMALASLTAASPMGRKSFLRSSSGRRLARNGVVGRDRISAQIAATLARSSGLLGFHGPRSSGGGASRLAFGWFGSLDRKRSLKASFSMNRLSGLSHSDSSATAGNHVK